MSFVSLITGVLTGPLTSVVVELVKSYNGRKINEREIEAAVAKAVLTVSSEIATSQANVIIKELEGPDRISRIWRPIVALACVSVLLAYGIVFPVMVAWFGFPPVKVGDQLLSWIFTLASGGMAGYIGSVTIENVARAWKRT